MAHITGGGFIENIPRVLPDGVNVEVDYGSWPILPIFSLLQEKGNVSNRDMFTTFNMGIGLVIVVSKDQEEAALTALRAAGENPYVIGRVTAGDRIVTFKGAEV
ncbi:Phosphoribosylformylglycinamidine cyclo-ligase [compost metagenome]